MYKLIITLMLSTLVVGGTAAWAEDQPSDQGYSEPATPPSGQQPGEVATGVTEKKAEPVADKGYLSDEIVGLRPQIGTMVYKDPADVTQARGAIGFTADMNALAAFTDNKDWNLGPSTGLLYSHLGATDGNFFGTTSTGAPNSGSNMAVIPLNVKAAYNFSKEARLGIHGGGNIVYRSITQSMVLSDSDPSSFGKDDWTLYPNVGADFEYGFGKSNIALLLRPDFTFGTAKSVFAGTVAMTIALS